MAKVAITRGEPLTRIHEITGALFGQPCCRKSAGSPRRGVSIGFGAQRFHGNPALVDSFYGEWEVGTYYAAWRVAAPGRILCGSDDVVDSTNELNERLSQIELGHPTGIEMLSEYDVRLALGAHFLDFLGTHGEEDEHVLHIFGPDDLYIEYSVARGWEIGDASNGR